MTRIAIIERDSTHSPNMVANDAAILECVAQELGNKGAKVLRTHSIEGCEADAVCHMSRTETTLQSLMKAEEQGTAVINSPQAVKNCSRLRMMNILSEKGIQQPPFTIIEEQTALDTLTYPAWIKRADGWSRHKNDVCFAHNATDAQKAIEEMRSRGIERQIHCTHIKGDIIKFYGVGSSFFHCCYPDPTKSKFGLERINGTPSHHPFSLDKMKECVFAAAEATGLEIYGGDCIVESNGEIYIIDLNDFPSFSAVRHQAAKEIAEYIINKIKKEQ